MPSDESHAAKRHPIQVVSRRAGLSAHVLRAWEKRYGAVAPERGPSGRRRYSDEDIERVQLMRAATAAGRRIGDIASLGLDELRALVAEDREAQVTLSESETPRAHAGQAVEQALQAIRALDAVKLRLLLSRALIALSPAVFMHEVATPVLYRVGDMWESGELTPGHEHLATAVFRRLLGEVVDTLQPQDAEPAIVVAAPAGQRHELGAMLVAMAAALEGWHVVFLGGDLPARDIARAAVDCKARAVAVSITRPGAEVPAEMEALRRALGTATPILVGGQGAATLHGRESKQVQLLPDLAAFSDSLRALANGGGPVSAQ